MVSSRCVKPGLGRVRTPLLFGSHSHGGMSVLLEPRHPHNRDVRRGGVSRGSSRPKVEKSHRTSENGNTYAQKIQTVFEGQIHVSLRASKHTKLWARKWLQATKREWSSPHRTNKETPEDGRKKRLEERPFTRHRRHEQRQSFSPLSTLQTSDLSPSPRCDSHGEYIPVRTRSII